MYLNHPEVVIAEGQEAEDEDKFVLRMLWAENGDEEDDGDDDDDDEDNTFDTVNNTIDGSVEAI